MEMEENQGSWSHREGCLKYLVMMTLLKMISGNIHYSIPEEMHKGSFVGDIAKDLEMSRKQFGDHGLRIVTNTGMIQYFELNFNTGHLQTSKRIDREEICGKAEKCILKLQIIAENNLKIYAIEVEIIDINDNAPSFLTKEWELKVIEISTLGSHFPLPEAQDTDIGINSVQSYLLKDSDYFSLDVQMDRNGVRHAELVLEKPLDREEQSFYELILTATDGGDPVRSGTTQIQVTVLDANDNAPVFGQSIYEVNVNENIPTWTAICVVRATDRDEGINADIKYSFQKISQRDLQMFQINSTTGEIILLGTLDFEAASFYEFEVQAMDGGGLSDRSRVTIRVTDLNDNAPELAMTFLTHSVTENSPAGAVIAIINVQDRDSGVNGEVKCTIPENLPFQIKKTIDYFYTLVTSKGLDREQVPAYNITIFAIDEGTPALSSSVLISLQVLDKNDNPPLFTQSIYNSFLLENNPRGTSIMSLTAQDPDWEENARIMYSIIESQTTDSLLSSWLSINSETGVVYALNSFDYEEVREIRFHVKVQDGGSPPLSSNISVTLFILDQNDNAPEILYPSAPTDGSTGIELAPHTSEPGYLVTKVVAVDKDSGQNAWLSYQLIKATEPGLFTLGLHTGEIRTARFFLEKDALKQTLVVLVKDNGQPSLSTSVTVTVVLADSIPAILSDLSSISPAVDPPSDLTFYLVIAVAFVSCLFFTFLLVLLGLKLHRWRSSQLFESGGVNFSGVPVSQFVGIDGVRAFLQSYCHEVSLTADSRKSQFNFSKAKCCNTIGSQALTGEAMDPILPVGDLNLNNGEQIIVEVS